MDALSPSSSPQIRDVQAEFWGFGIGLGLFTSVFALSGFAVIGSAWSEFFSQQKFTPKTLCLAVFQTIFGIPFVGCPLLVWSSKSDVWLIPCVGYGVPFLLFLLFAYGRNGALDCDNPWAKKVIAEDQLYPEVRKWLNDIELDQYYGTFTKNGYEKQAHLETLTEKDLKKLGIKKYFHEKKILAKVQGQIVKSNAVPYGRTVCVTPTMDDNISILVGEDKPPRELDDSINY